MRLPLLVLAAALLAAGCVGPAATDEPTPDPAAPAGDDASATAEEEEVPTFCEEEEGCDFWDEDYHEYVLYNVDTYVIDVLVVPSASADTLDDTPVLKAAVDAWAAGVEQLGESWFTANFTINAYLLGTDTPPADAIQDPEIIVLAAEYNPFLLLGIGLEPKQFSCQVFGQDTLRAYPVHSHHGMQITASDCTGIGFLCVAANTNFLTGSAIQLQDLVAHEFGHCLGGGHVGDALDFRAKRVPIADIMSYQHDEEQVHCVSNLNVRVLEALYAPLMGVTVDTPVAAGDFYMMPAADYEQVECANP